MTIFALKMRRAKITKSGNPLSSKLNVELTQRSAFRRMSDVSYPALWQKTEIFDSYRYNRNLALIFFIAMRRKALRFSALPRLRRSLTGVAESPWNRWQDGRGLGGRMAVDLGGRMAVEYAAEC